jgi:hypothetical protein
VFHRCAQFDLPPAAIYFITSSFTFKCCDSHINSIISLRTLVSVLQEAECFWSHKVAFSSAYLNLLDVIDMINNTVIGTV